MTARHHPGGTRDGPAGGDAGPAPPGPVARARQAAGSELRRRRVAAGLTQAELGNRIGYARTTIGEAETRGAGAPSLWKAADAELAVGGELILLNSAAEAAAAAAAAAADAARPGRLSVVPGPLPARPDRARPAGGAAAAPGSCPHCGRPLLLATHVTGAAPGPGPAPAPQG